MLIKGAKNSRTVNDERELWRRVRAFDDAGDLDRLVGGGRHAEGGVGLHVELVALRVHRAHHGLALLLAVTQLPVTVVADDLLRKTER